MLNRSIICILVGVIGVVLLVMFVLVNRICYSIRSVYSILNEISDKDIRKYVNRINNSR